MPHESVSLVMPDGVKLHVTQLKRGSPTCIFVHGLGEGAFVWENLCNSISSDCSIITIDLRGHGESDWDPQAKYSSESYLTDVGNIIEALKLDDILLIGHSLGGNLSIAITKRLTELVNGLIIIDSSPSISGYMNEYMLREFQQEHKGYSSVESYFKIIHEKRPLPTERTLRQFAQGALRKADDGLYYLKRDPALGSDENWEVGDTVNIWTELDRISCPVLLLRGAGSAVLQKPEAERLAREFRSCDYLNIPMSGHSIMLDNPDDLAKHVNHFISKIINKQNIHQTTILPKPR